MGRVRDNFTVTDCLTGYAFAHQDKIILQSEPKVVFRRFPSENKVALVSGGGSGHEPLHVGFVGKGMLDAACPGEIFTSPTPEQIVSAINQFRKNSGVLLIIKNYQGDKLNFELASELTDVGVKSVLVNDDAAGQDRNSARGLAGVVIVEKILGAAAENGLELSQLERLGKQVSERTRSLGIAFSSCSWRSGSMSTVKENELEYGVGIHGELGALRIERPSLSSIVSKVINDIIASLGSYPKNPILLVNGLGVAPLTLLYQVAEIANKNLSSKGISIARVLVGNFVTTLDTNGFSLTITDANPEWLPLWDSAVYTPALVM
ncbi:dihydroxyacetone kinase subunit DhaK [Vibrio nigripulchritudo]|uniref:dihydroxyacetone kinase subunit DhaK n=1 Tax=Vibrio nigripulchritudo TaxID=28173 RepID=UPI002491AC6B|nr:dihydroxyacetone kinase subunit DhaK [Vibrio nigripulchritudo]BDU37952.1 dihydroxyacetone kinase subunit DhaK [Vibrio nigripulchritudo]BDU43674.1 dihydroxyacetone kinase subunit DhaK [Vibrio nigripulchritudo]